METKRILVCGGRDYDDWIEFCRFMEVYHIRYNLTVIHGDAKGADFLARVWAKGRRVPFVKEERYPADWNKYKGGAGPIRNKKMLDEGKPDLVVAFPGGRGTADMIKQSKAAGVKVIEVGYDN